MRKEVSSLLSWVWPDSGEDFPRTRNCSASFFIQIRTFSFLILTNRLQSGQKKQCWLFIHNHQSSNHLIISNEFSSLLTIIHGSYPSLTLINHHGSMFFRRCWLVLVSMKAMPGWLLTLLSQVAGRRRAPAFSQGLPRGGDEAVDGRRGMMVD